MTRAARVGAPPPPAGPPPRSVALSDPVSRLPGIGSARAARLAEAGLTMVAHVLRHLPFRYEDRRRFGKVAELAPGEPATLFVRLAGAKGYRMRRGGMRVEALADDGSEAIRVVWHNRYPSFLQAAQSGRPAVLYGAPAVTSRGELRLENPETEFFEPGEEADPLHSGRIVGVARRVAEISPRAWRALVRRALDALSPDFESASGPSSDIVAALEAAHFPAEIADAQRARFRLAREELLALAARIEDKRARLLARKGIPLAADDALRREAARALPFPLTGAQKRAVAEISADVRSGRAMARLLQGDVGSGKTIVAGLGLLLAARNRVQGALMAPTEILAEQHMTSLAAWLGAAGVRVALLTGRVRGKARQAVLAGLERGSVDVVVGTHALAESPVRFRRLALVVVDEQHRFGVAHRARLFRKGESPHILVMTATPIPRSLAWAIYGELDVSVLDEKPPGRAPITTRVRGPEARARIYAFAAERVRAGERAYVVVPAIEEGEREVAATRDTAARVAAAAPDVAVGTLHGRMPPDERSAVMADFAAGRTGILVATTVVEVGVDVPEATVMVVENAETFGLAQLHQLRGRVGRSSRPSWCVLVAGERATDEAKERLALLEKTTDGFVIAEKDLEARGPGDLLGFRQSGLPPLSVADPVRDLPALADARREVVARRGRGERIASDLFGYREEPRRPDERE
ncbi:MAG TPA: ATP-dependent DNA helicase RecG [Thermoanaerobaculia bacterium]|nr:ATP-dependent DNA helicase RecG [Thermoanaerobaculia bacterium]